MQLTVNGTVRTISEGATLADLARELGLEGKAVAFELNREVVTKARFREAKLREGDRLEIVTFVGGG